MDSEVSYNTEWIKSISWPEFWAWGEYHKMSKVDAIEVYEKHSGIKVKEEAEAETFAEPIPEELQHPYTPPDYE